MLFCGKGKENWALLSMCPKICRIMSMPHHFHIVHMGSRWPRKPALVLSKHPKFLMTTPLIWKDFMIWHYCCCVKKLSICHFNNDHSEYRGFNHFSIWNGFRVLDNHQNFNFYNYLYIYILKINALHKFYKWAYLDILTQQY